MDEVSPEVAKLAGQILAVIGKRSPVDAMQALLICMEAIDFVANPKNDIAANEAKS